MKALSLGIDLGTTFSAIAVLDPGTGKPNLVPNADGDRLTPSAVYLTESGDLQVGTVAVGQAKRTPERVKCWIKREMGQDKGVRLGDRSFRPEELSAAILAKLLQDAEQYFATTITKAVVTVPAYFDEPRRKATKDAAAIAGIEATLINEPTAAGLVYGMQDHPGKTFLVYDLGGGTFDVSLMRATGSEMEVIATAGEHHLGGYDFDTLLAQHLSGLFEEEHGIGPYLGDPQSAADWHDLMIEAEDVKKRLSRMEEAQATVRFRGKRSDFVVSRQEFEELVAPYISRTESLVDQVLEEAAVEPIHVDALLMVGGSTRIPAVREAVRRILTHLEPLPGVNPDEAVAQGAAMRAHILAGEAAGPIQTVHDVTAHPYGVLVLDPETGQPVNEVLIPRNSRVPHAVERTYFTAAEGQVVLDAKITQGESPRAESVQVVAATELSLPPGRPPGRPIDVAYAYDEEGRMRCEFVDRETGQRAGLDYTAGTVGVMSEEEVAQAKENFETYTIT